MNRSTRTKKKPWYPAYLRLPRADKLTTRVKEVIRAIGDGEIPPKEIIDNEIDHYLKQNRRPSRQRRRIIKDNDKSFNRKLSKYKEMFTQGGVEIRLAPIETPRVFDAVQRCVSAKTTRRLVSYHSVGRKMATRNASRAL